MRLALAVAAKGALDPTPFLVALEREGAWGRPDIAVHLAHDAPWQAPRPPGLVLHPRPEEGSVLRLWGAAVAAAAATAEHVAVLDAQSPPLSGWLGHALAKAAGGAWLACGPVEPGWLPEDPPLIGYLVEYAQFKLPVDPALEEVPGNNLVVHRDLLPDPKALALVGFEKTFLVQRLARERGLHARRCEGMAVAYLRACSLGAYCARRYRHARSFAARRLQQPGQPPRLLCLGFTPLLPVLRVARIRRACRRDPGLATAFRRQVGSILLAELAWSWGEALGYAMGDGGSGARLD